MSGGSYQPENCKVRCQWIDCYAGLGLAGSGFCFAAGQWWADCCAEYVNEDDYLAEMAGYPEHDVESGDCWCNPTVEDYEHGKVIVHNDRQ